MTQWGLDTLFNPAKRHMDEEKQRLQSTREEVGDSSGGKRIDLESGRVTIRRDEDAAAGAEPEVDAEGEASAEGEANAKGVAAPAGVGTERSGSGRTTSRAKQPAGEPSAAARRAAARRGRQPR